MNTKNETCKGENTMKNTLVIDNFLIFDHVEIDINKFTVFIGPQASGKSIAAKLLYFFYHFPEFVFEVALAEGKKRELLKLLKENFYEIFPPYSWNNKNFEIALSTEQGTISINHQPDKVLNFAFSEYYEDKIKNSLSLSKKFKSTDEKFPRRLELSRYLTKKIHSVPWGFINAESSALIPAGRSFFATLSNNIFTFLANDNKIDYFLKEFGDFYEWAIDFRSYPPSEREVVKAKFDDICQKLMHAVLVKRNKKTFLKHKDKNLEIEIKDVSSGQQELLPILATMFARAHYFFIIEEPEAHIFPESQSEVVKFIVSTQIVKSNERAFLFTTHSPYVLTTLNNLAYAGVLEAKLQQKNDIEGIEKLDKIYTIQERIPEKSLSAYYFNNGKATNIIDEETGLINAEDLDKISDVTSEKFSELIDLKLQYDNNAEEEE